MASIFFFIGLRGHVKRNNSSWVDSACIMVNVNNDATTSGCPEPENGAENVSMMTQYVVRERNERKTRAGTLPVVPSV
jgi:hypothetical protein